MVVTPFEYKEAVSEIAGAQWDGRHQWWTVPASPVSAEAVCSVLRQVWDTHRGGGVQVSDVVRDLAKSAADSARVAEIAHASAARIARPSEGADEGADLIAALDAASPGIVGRVRAATTTTAWRHQTIGSVFLATHKGALVAAGMGCLAGDTEVVVNRGGAARRRRIADLVHSFNGGESGRYGTGHRWDLTIPTRVQVRADDGTLRLGTLRRAWCSGERETFTVTTRGGRTIRATATHPFLTPDGTYSQLGDLAVGSEVIVRRDGRGTGQPRGAKLSYRHIHGLRHHPHAVAFKPGIAAVLEHRVVAEATVNNVTLDQFVDRVRAGDLDGLRFLDPRTEHVHHIDLDHRNNAPSNLMVTDPSEHRRAHAVDHGTTVHVLQRSEVDVVTGIEPFGVETTYDLEMEDEPHNFVANGFVVHNSGKSLMAVAALNATSANLAVVVCPRKVIGVWPRELRRHSSREWHVENGLRQRPRTGRWYALPLTERRAAMVSMVEHCRCGRPHMLVLNYEALTFAPFKTLPVPKGATVDVVVYDEADRLRSSANKAAGEASTTAGRWQPLVGRAWGLTGTPLPQTPLDAQGMFRALDPGIFGTVHGTFRKRYGVIEAMPGADNPNSKVSAFATQVVGYKNMDEFAERFFSITYLPTVDLELPGATDVTIDVELEKDARKVYDQLDKESWADLMRAPIIASRDDTAAADVDFNARGEAVVLAEELSSGEFLYDDESAGGGTVSAANAMVRLLRLQQLAAGAVQDEDGNLREVSTAKADALAEVMDQIGCKPGGPSGDGQPEPLVVFTRFRHGLVVIARIAAARGLRYAEVSGTRGDGLTQDSTMTPDADVVGIQIQSGGVGVDLTRARYAVYYSVGYSLRDFEQSLKRLDRPGQTRPVTNIYLNVVDTVDPVVYDALKSRRAVIGAVLADRGVDADRIAQLVPAAERDEAAAPDFVAQIKAAKAARERGEAPPEQVVHAAPTAAVQLPAAVLHGARAGQPGRR